MRRDVGLQIFARASHAPRVSTSARQRRNATGQHATVLRVPSARLKPRRARVGLVEGTFGGTSILSGARSFVPAMVATTPKKTPKSPAKRGAGEALARHR